MKIVPSDGDSAEVTPFQHSMADIFEAGAHDDETGGDDADVHFDDGDGQGGDIRPLVDVNT